MKPIYRIHYSGDAFGDNLFSAYLTYTLIRNGFDAYLDNKRIAHLVDCPTFSDKFYKGNEIRSFDCVRQNRTGLQTKKKFNVYTDLVFQFKKKFNIKTPIKLQLTYIPVKYKRENDVPSFDVVMVTQTGYWSPYRNWPYFSELKKMLIKSSISFIDITEEKIQNNFALNIVDNCRLFLGLETGVSHYVSKFANGKALILQSGYTTFDYWASIYNYKELSISVDCKPCWKREGCLEHNCMSYLKPSYVYEEILRELNNDR